MQVTTRKKQLKSKSEAVLLQVAKRMREKAEKAIDTLEQITPVHTGAYAEAMQINRRGVSTGPQVPRGRKTVKEDETSKQSVRSIMAERLRDQADSISDIEQGFTFVNKQEYSKWVDRKYALSDVIRNLL